MTRASTRGGRAGALVLACALVVLGVALLAARPARAATDARLVAPPKLSVTGAALLDATDGQILYGRNLDTERAIASTTKLMTALVTLAHEPNLNKVVAQNNWYPAPVDSQIGLVPGERMSVHDLLIAMMLPSADDAAEDLAYNVGGGSVARFIAMMNARARALHLTHTHYSTPSGLDTPGNYSTPRDLVRLAAYVMSHSAFLRHVVALPSAVLRTGRYRRTVVNLNDLVRRFRWINGVKTGHTTDAGYVLVASGTRDGMTLVDAVLGTTSEAARDANALALLRYGFAAFHRVMPVRAGQVLARPVVEDSRIRHAVVVAASGFTGVVSRGDAVRVAVQVPARLTAPLPRRAVVGQAVVRAGRRVLARVPLVLQRAVPALSPVAQVGRFLSRTSTLIGLVIAAVLGGAVAWRRRPRVSARGHLEEG